MQRSETQELATERRRFAERVEQYQHSLFGYLSRLGLPDGVINDVAQEAFLRAWHHRDRYDASRSQWNTWVFRIARNLAFTALQRMKRTESTEPSELERVVVDEMCPDVVAEHGQKRARLRNALTQLNETERDSLALAYVQGIPSEEAAAILGCEAGTFRTRVSRARARLTALLESDV